MLFIFLKLLVDRESPCSSRDDLWTNQTACLTVTGEWERRGGRVERRGERERERKRRFHVSAAGDRDSGRRRTCSGLTTLLNLAFLLFPSANTVWHLVPPVSPLRPRSLTLTRQTEIHQWKRKSEPTQSSRVGHLFVSPAAPLSALQADVKVAQRRFLQERDCLPLTLPHLSARLKLTHCCCSRGE